jgi:hypothetical protein
MSKFYGTGAFTGYKPKWIRKPFKFLYKDEQ